MALKNIWPRIFFVLWAIPLTLLLINISYDLRTLLPTSLSELLHPIYIATVVAFLLIIFAAKEYIDMLTKEYPKNKFYLLFLWLIPALGLALLENPSIQFEAILYLLFVLVIIESFVFGDGNDRWKRVSLLLGGGIFLYLSGFGLFKYYTSDFLSIWKWSFPDTFGNWGIIITLGAIFACDSAAYFVGSLIGKRPFSSISPKKTIEGSIGGLLAAIIVMTIAVTLGRSDSTPLYLGPLLGIVIGVFGQMGDLTASLIKRTFDVKDSSNLIPGHGGILDRFDSMFFTAPAVHILISFVLKIS